MATKLLDREFNRNEYMWEAGRFKSFKKWPFTSSSRCAAVQMAQAGWYCTSHDPDDPSARCAFCLKELSGWEPTDDPWDEHMKHSSACLFVQFRKKEAELTVREMIQLTEQRVLKIMEHQHKEDLKKLNEEKENILQAFEASYGVKESKE
ncbi:baculoviral IAP repeat-containing protein 5-like [Macrosteles quadrilineatus]|uniref:baculoviral IAP repeat-containing protein 5-like n=1 Tax=Macrosteles quadrilineatus TaxID=74068 RepID=UPI0023E21B5E|nr:baculoviral IAP repeat-containing protein 5-like [Macrosteles quadrilineatus]